jgi:hypothetical protein
MSIQTIIRSGLVLLGLLLLAAAPATGRTWNVEKDGSGDFTVIQDAVDAASDGDEIRIGPGRYEEFQTVQSGAHLYDLHVWVPDGMSLDFVGAGHGSTIIGPADAASHENRTYGIAGIDDVGITIRNVGIENCNMYGIGIQTGVVNAEDCRFEYSGEMTSNTQGINGRFMEHGVIRNCVFRGLADGVHTTSAPSGLDIEDCEFDGWGGVYAWTNSVRDLKIDGCHFESWPGGVSLLDGVEAEVTECVFVNSILEISNTGPVVVANCVVRRSDNDVALYLSNNEPVTIVDNIFESNGEVVRLTSYGLGEIRNNHFISTGDGYAVYCSYHPSFQQDIDLSGNWWGTTDPNVVDELIYDCHDDQNSYHCVIYEPMAGQPVEVEAKSWSAVKELFK